MYPSTVYRLSFLSFVALSYAATDMENAITCGRLNPDINTAIDQFCFDKNAKGQFMDNIVVPSTYAAKGSAHGNAKVMITGDCTPAQWVPLNWCEVQFHDMCASMKEGQGIVQATYGRNNCQIWTIVQ